MTSTRGSDTAAYGAAGTDTASTSRARWHRSVPLARRLVLRSRSRFGFSALAATAVIGLVIVELSILFGMLRTVQWVENAGADLWITTEAEQPEWTPIPDGVLEQVRTRPDVATVVPITRSLVEIVPEPGRSHTGFARAWPAGDLDIAIVAGRAPETGDEIVIDEGLAAEYDVVPGDDLALTSQSQRRNVEVVGTTRGASLLVFQNVLMTPDTVAALEVGDDESAAQIGDAATELDALAARFAAATESVTDATRGLFDISGRIDAVIESLEAAADQADAARAALEDLEDFVEPSRPSALAVTVDDGADVEAVRAALAGLDAEIVAHTDAEYSNVVKSGSIGPMMPVIYVLVGAAVVVGTLVLGLTLSTLVSESLPDFAVLEALGASPGRLRRTVLREGVILVGTALVFGLGLGLLAVEALGAVLPLVPIHLHPAVFGYAAAAAVFMGLAGTLLPIRRVMRLDPVSVFQEGG